MDCLVGKSSCLLIKCHLACGLCLERADQVYQCSQAGDCACVAALATDHNLEAVLAITAAGGIAAPLNWRYGADIQSTFCWLLDTMKSW